MNYLPVLAVLYFTCSVAMAIGNDRTQMRTREPYAWGYQFGYSARRSRIESYVFDILAGPVVIVLLFFCFYVLGMKSANYD